MNQFHFHPMNESIAWQISGWRYDPPYNIYDCNSEDVEGHLEEFLQPENHYYSVWSQEEFIGFRCFGKEAQVPGGNYSANALDMGGGIRPDLTGIGLGPKIMKAAMEFAKLHFHPQAFRATVAAFNQRAIKACEKVGYRRTDTFRNPNTHREFVILMREVG